VVTGSGTDGTALLDGFTITDGRADGDPALGHTLGGGMYNWVSDPTLADCVFVGNSACEGGGVHCWIGGPTLSGCTFSSNSAYQGGAVYALFSDATLTNNLIVDNQASISGSGVYVGASFPRLLQATIARNHGRDGSGLHVTGGSTVVLTNTILVSHTVGITVAVGNTANTGRRTVGC